MHLWMTLTWIEHTLLQPILEFRKIQGLSHFALAANKSHVLDPCPSVLYLVFNKGSDVKLGFIKNFLLNFKKMDY
jgi:hypothetical protein